MWITIYVNDFVQFNFTKNFVHNDRSTHESTHECLFTLLTYLKTGCAKGRRNRRNGFATLLRVEASRSNVAFQNTKCDCLFFIIYADHICYDPLFILIDVIICIMRCYGNCHVSLGKIHGLVEVNNYRIEIIVVSYII